MCPTLIVWGVIYTFSYLSIARTNTSTLPENIGKMKLLQYINLCGCKSLVNLPSSIVMLQHLRFLNIAGTGISNIPKGFHGLANLRNLYMFPVHMDGDWCSLEELGPLSQLTRLHKVVWIMCLPPHLQQRPGLVKRCGLGICP